MAICGKFFIECVSNGIISWKCLFLLNCEFFWVKIREYDEETKYFEKKTLSSSKKASLPKWEGGKYAGGSRSLLHYYKSALLCCFRNRFLSPFNSRRIDLFSKWGVLSRFQSRRFSLTSKSAASSGNRSWNIYWDYLPCQRHNVQAAQLLSIRIDFKTGKRSQNKLA